jgi:hypothetical protein
LWATERTWEIVNDAVQIRGGRGFETAASLAARGEPPIPVERFLRDSRINMLFEGSSEIMRLFIAREALDPHLKVSGAALNSQLPWSQRLKAAAKAALFYAGWYPRQWLPFAAVSGETTNGKGKPSLAPHLRFAARNSRRLARAIFHAMLRYGPKLERQQILLGRFVDISAEIFAMTAVCLRAAQLGQSYSEAAGNTNALELADYFCRASRLKIAENFRSARRNTDHAGYRLAQSVLAGKLAELETGIVAKTQEP